jgi:hypothetical protein
MPGRRELYYDALQSAIVPVNKAVWDGITHSVEFPSKYTLALNGPLLEELLSPLLKGL